MLMQIGIETSLYSLGHLKAQIHNPHLMPIKD